MKKGLITLIAGLFLLSCSKDHVSPCQDCTFIFRSPETGELIETDYSGIGFFVYTPSPIADKCSYLDTSKAEDVQSLYVGRKCN